MKTKLALAFAVLLFASLAHVDQIVASTGVRNFPGRQHGNFRYLYPVSTRNRMGKHLSGGL